MADKVKQELLLTPAEASKIIPGIRHLPTNVQFLYCPKCSTELLEAQLTKAEPLIRKDERERILGKDRPKIICLCGSTRFVDTFNEWRKKLTVEGNIVVSIELILPQSEREDPQHSNYKVKQMLDALHLRKIDIADEVMILNVGGYIGESTAEEIKYAESLNKPIKYLEALKGEGKG